MSQADESKPRRNLKKATFKHRPEYEELGRLLRRIREKKGLEQRPLSRSINKSGPFLNKVEMGKQRIDVIELVDLLAKLDMTFVEFAQEYELAKS